MPLPQVPSRFQALEELVRGETCVLVRARDTLLQREVVLKLPPEGPRPDLEGERELREARALARVQHRGIVRLLDVIETPAGPVLVLEPASGESLAEKLAREQRLEAEFVRMLALELADALTAVHAIGVVHRGITLDQIVLGTDGRPLLGGFGFAKFSGPALAIPGTTFLYARDSKPSAALPPHPAPEQIAGQAADARSDLFGLGWVLYECLTGEEPYPIELETEHWKSPRDPRALVPGTPRGLSDAVLRCLAKSPSKRFASAEELRAALERPAASPAAPRKALDRRHMFSAAGVLVLGLAGFVAWRASHSTEGAGTRGHAVFTAADKVIAGPPYATLRAVVIGINEYQDWPPLGCAVADALEVARLLEQSFGFERANIVTLTDGQATRQRIYDAVGEVSEKAGGDDGLLFYFAGHGQTAKLHPGGDMGYLVPVDGKLEPAAAMGSLIPMDVVEMWSRQLPCKHVFFVLDSCFSGLATARGMTDADREYLGGLARLRGCTIVTAGGKGEVSVEDPKVGHSYFTKRLLQGLGTDLVQAHPDGVITAGELATYLRTNVARDTAGTRTRQNPKSGSFGDGEGEFLFLTNEARTELSRKK